MRASGTYSSRRDAVLRLAGKPPRGSLSRRDSAFSRRLCHEVTAWRARLDWSLARLVKRPLQGLEPAVLAALRLGAAQLILLKTPPHAAVSETVQAAPRRARGLVNAVLRRLAREGEGSGPKELHVRYSHPRPLVERWIHRLGRERTEGLLAWNNSIPELGWFCLEDDCPGRPGRYLAGYRLLDDEDLPEEGLSGLLDRHRAYVQDEAAALVGRGAGMLARGRILELGAAPGGKTLHLAGRGPVVAVDLSARRMRTWRRNARRLDLLECVGVAADAGALPLSRPFDTVMVDAPCTGTGVYRRRRDARYGWSQTLLEGCVRSQTELLEAAASLLAPGGVLIYSTCSLEPEENQQAVKRLEDRHSDLSRVGFPAPDKLVSRGMVSIFPPDSGIDGMFAAAWKKAP